MENIDNQNPGAPKPVAATFKAKLLDGKSSYGWDISGPIPLSTLVAVTKHDTFGYNAEDGTPHGVNRLAQEKRARSIAKTWDMMLKKGHAVTMGVPVLVTIGQKLPKDDDGLYTLKGGSLPYVDFGHRGLALKIAGQEQESYSHLFKYMQEGNTVPVHIIYATDADVARSIFVLYNDKQKTVAKGIKLAINAEKPDEELTDKEIDNKAIFRSWRLLHGEVGGPWHNRIDLSGDTNPTIKELKNRLASIGNLVTATQVLLVRIKKHEKLKGSEDMTKALHAILKTYFENLRDINPIPFENYEDHTIQRKHGYSLVMILTGLMTYFYQMRKNKKSPFKDLTAIEFLNGPGLDLMKTQGSVLTFDEYWANDGKSGQDQFVRGGWNGLEALCEMIFLSIKPKGAHHWMGYLPTHKAKKVKHKKAKTPPDALDDSDFDDAEYEPVYGDA